MSIEARIKDATKQVVLSFQPTFVQTMDRMRHRMGAFYRPTSTLVWNGELISGADSIAAFYNTLPITNTVFTTFDVQPLVSLFPLLASPSARLFVFHPSFFFSNNSLTHSHCRVLLDTVNRPDVEPVCATMLITATGHVEYDGSNARSFGETFVLRLDPSTRTWFIQSDCFRLDT